MLDYYYGAEEEEAIEHRVLLETDHKKIGDFTQKFETVITLPLLQAAHHRLRIYTRYSKDSKIIHRYS